MMTDENGQSTSHPLIDPQQISQHEYQAYLLRLWRSHPEAPWRGSLQSIRTGERRLFTDLETLFAFLVEHLSKAHKP
jgi:hypothetical protein